MLLSTRAKQAHKIIKKTFRQNSRETRRGEAMALDVGECQLFMCTLGTEEVGQIIFKTTIVSGPDGNNNKTLQDTPKAFKSLAI